MMVHSWSLSTWELKAGKSKVRSIPWLYNTFRGQPGLKNQPVLKLYGTKTEQEDLKLEAVWATVKSPPWKWNKKFPWKFRRPRIATLKKDNTAQCQDVCDLNLRALVHEVA